MTQQELFNKYKEEKCNKCKEKDNCNKVLKIRIDRTVNCYEDKE